MVRRATAADAGTLARMLRDFNAEFGSPAPAQDVLTRRLSAMLARDDVVGLVAGAAPEGFALATLRPTPYYDGPLAVLDELYVVPSLRDQGIGSALMAALLEQLRSLDCGELHINVDGEDHDARRFYEARGFRNREPGQDEQMLLYVQEL